MDLAPKVSMRTAALTVYRDDAIGIKDADSRVTRWEEAAGKGGHDVRTFNASFSFGLLLTIGDSTILVRAL